MLVLEHLGILPGEDAEEPLLRAVYDLQRDLRALTGRGDDFPVGSGCGITVGRMEGAAESYAVTVTSSGIDIRGTDVLGKIYGIYETERLVFGIDPMWRYNGVRPKDGTVHTAEECSFSGSPSGCAFRGWFLNDEDLLSEFHTQGGERHIDYPFYAHVMSTEVLDAILETALRLRLNLIIPSSFVDIRNPDEEALVKTVYRRGLYITQHHVEPMGVSYFAADAFFAEHGVTDGVSFLRHPELYEACWRTYAKAWAKYGDRVIWQLGLRGKADRPVWQADRSVEDTLDAHGALISDAIGRQYAILCEVLGNKDFRSTTTLWMEGAALYGAGKLHVPDGCTVVFSDIGFHQMFSEDFYSVPRKPGASYGVYYHAAFWGNGPHLAEGLNPEKQLYSYAEARRTGTLFYSILNVSNLREVHSSARLNAFLLWEGEDFDYPAYCRTYDALLFGDAAEKYRRGMERYYHAFADAGDDACEALCRTYDFHYHKTAALPFVSFTANDGTLRSWGCTLLAGKTLSRKVMAELVRSEAEFAALDGYWASAEPAVPAERREYFAVYIRLQTRYLLYLERWILALARGDIPAAYTALETILTERKTAETGFWEGWYDGDGKMDVPALLEQTKRKE